jgi:hypothetical protein
VLHPTSPHTHYQIDGFPIQLRCALFNRSGRQKQCSGMDASFTHEKMASRVQQFATSCSGLFHANNWV